MVLSAAARSKRSPLVLTARTSAVCALDPLAQGAIACLLRVLAPDWGVGRGGSDKTVELQSPRCEEGSQQSLAGDVPVLNDAVEPL